MNNRRDHSLCVARFRDDNIRKPQQAFYDKQRQVQYATCLKHQKLLKLGKYKQYIPLNGSEYDTW